MERAALSPAPIPRSLRVTLAIACLLLGAGASLTYRYARSLEASAERFVRQFALDRRHPSDVVDMRLEPAGDLACAAAVDSALGDFLSGAVPSSEANSDVPSRAVGKQALTVRSEEIRAARDLMLAAVFFRPGWGYHRYLLGKAAYAGEKQLPAGDPARRTELWASPLRLASAAAPGLPAIWVTRGQAYLESWPELTTGERYEAPLVLARAFRDADFISKRFLPAVTILGRDAAIGLLPDDARLLDKGIEVLTKQGDATGAALLWSRREKAEARERAADLAWIEERSRLNDWENLRDSCKSWVYRHPVSELGDPSAATQAGRVLSLWPGDGTGVWGRDSRTDLIEFFLAGRQAYVKGEVLSRTIESLSGVPETVRGRVKALAGDLEGAEDIAIMDMAADRLKGTPIFLEVARAEFRLGRVREAWLALQSVPPQAQENCDVLLARRDVARALGSRIEIEAVNRSLESSKSVFQTQKPWTEGGTLILCLDPEETGGQILEIEVESGSSAFIEYGWDGTWVAHLLVSPGRNVLAVPLAGLGGRRTLSVKALAGGPVQLGTVAVGHPA